MCLRFCQTHIGSVVKAEVVVWGRVRLSHHHQDIKIEILPDTGRWQGLTKRSGGSLEAGTGNTSGEREARS